MTERKHNYPVARENGRGFLRNWRKSSGSKGYRVVFDADGDTGDDWAVFSYTGAFTDLVERDLTEEGAHELAASLAKLPVHPRTPDVRERYPSESI